MILGEGLGYSWWVEFMGFYYYFSYGGPRTVRWRDGEDFPIDLDPRMRNRIHRQRIVDSIRLDDVEIAIA